MRFEDVEISLLNIKIDFPNLSHFVWDYFTEIKISN